MAFWNIGYRPGSADMAGTHYERINSNKNKSLLESEHSQSHHSNIEEIIIADKVDEEDSCKEEMPR